VKIPNENNTTEIKNSIVHSRLPTPIDGISCENVSGDASIMAAAGNVSNKLEKDMTAKGKLNMLNDAPIVWIFSLAFIF